MSNLYYIGAGSPIPWSGLTSYWRFDESSGNAADSKGGITLTGTSVSYTTGKHNNCAVITTGKFDSYNNTTMNFEYTEPHSWAGWVNRSATGVKNLFGNAGGGDGKGYSADFITQSNQLQFAMYSNVGANNYLTAWCTGFTTGQWFHWCITYDGTGGNGSTSIKMYKNGIEQHSYGVSVSLSGSIVSTTTFKVGNSGSASYDEVGIWNRVLSAADIKALYDYGQGMFY